MHRVCVSLSLSFSLNGKQKIWRFTLCTLIFDACRINGICSCGGGKGESRLLYIIRRQMRNSIRYFPRLVLLLLLFMWQNEYTMPLCHTCTPSSHACIVPFFCVLNPKWWRKTFYPLRILCADEWNARCWVRADMDTIADLIFKLWRHVFFVCANGYYLTCSATNECG